MIRIRWRIFLVLALVLLAVGAATGHGFATPVAIAVTFFVLAVAWDVLRVKFLRREEEVRRQ